MKAYLDDCHHHYSTQEEPLRFPAPRYVIEYSATETAIWLWELSDERGRDWWIVTGSGKSPAATYYWRWLYAVTKAGESAEECMAKLLKEFGREVKMGDLTRLKSEIEKLSGAEQEELRSWLQARADDAWDAQIAADVAAGKLDSLIAEGEADLAAGRVRDL
jgi:hypothetical protein